MKNMLSKFKPAFEWLVSKIPPDEDELLSVLVCLFLSDRQELTFTPNVMSGQVIVPPGIYGNSETIHKQDHSFVIITFDDGSEQELVDLALPSIHASLKPSFGGPPTEGVYYNFEGILDPFEYLMKIRQNDSADIFAMAVKDMHNVMQEQSYIL